MKTKNRCPSVRLIRLSFILGILLGLLFALRGRRSVLELSTERNAVKNNVLAERNVKIKPELVLIWKCPSVCSKSKISSNFFDIITNRFHRLDSFVGFFDTVNIIISSQCDSIVEEIVSEYNIPNDLVLNIYSVGNGLEMNNLLLISWKTEFFQEISTDNLGKFNGTLNWFESKLGIDKLYKYPFYELRFPAVATSKDYIYISEFYNIKNESFNSIVKDISNSRALLVYQDFDESPFKSLNQQIIDTYFLHFLFKRENKVHRKIFSPGVYPESVTSLEWNNTKQKRQFEEWFKSFGASVNDLPSFREQSSIEIEVLKKLKPVAMIGFNIYNIQQHLRGKFLDYPEDFQSGTAVTSQFLRGPLFTFNNARRLLKVSYLECDRSMDTDIMFEELHLLHTPIRSRHLTLYTNMLTKFLNKTHISPHYDPKSKYLFFSRTHKTGERIRSYLHSWTRQMAKIQVPVSVNLVSSNEKVLNSFLKLKESTEDKLSVLVTNGNYSTLAKYFPIEALELFQASQRLLGGNKYSRKSIGDRSFLSVNLTSSQLPWIYTQLTWAATYASLLLEKTLATSQNEYFWFFDYDVMFSGDISMIIALTDDIVADFLAPSQELNNRHIMETILESEAVEHENHWTWWTWGEYFVKAKQEIFKYERCDADFEFMHEEARPLLRRSFATSFRLSRRMIEWVLEALLDAEELFWPLDELLYRNICEFREECIYFSLNAVDTMRFEPGHRPGTVIQENIPNYGLNIVNFLSTFRNHRSRKSEPRFIGVVNVNGTRNELWHPVKNQTVLANEHIWLDLE